MEKMRPQMVVVLLITLYRYMYCKLHSAEYEVGYLALFCENSTSLITL